MTLHKDMVKMVVDRLPVDVRNLLEQTGPLTIVAGGFVRDVITGAEPKDIDIFAIHEYEMVEAIEYFDNESTMTPKQNSNSVTFTGAERIPVQFVERTYYEFHNDLIASFDWSICQAGVYYDPIAGQWKGICSDQFWADILTDAMHYTAPDRDEDPGASVLRMMRFTEKGYHAPEEEVAKCIGRMAQEIVKETSNVGCQFGPDWVETIKGTFRSVGYSGKKGTKK